VDNDDNDLGMLCEVKVPAIGMMSKMKTIETANKMRQRLCGNVQS
jgi:hypothetical protein